MIDYQGESVLDIGSGTGLFLDYVDCISNYTGCDPSHRMSAVLEAKYPGAQVVRTRFEEFASAQKYDLIISLFGSASYVSPSALSRIKTMLTAGGRYFLMLYKPGYTPITYIKSGVKTKHYPYAPIGMGENVTEFKNFIILQGDAKQ
jgi:SAM-dependent methyltransferase